MPEPLPPPVASEVVKKMPVPGLVTVPADGTKKPVFRSSTIRLAPLKVAVTYWVPMLPAGSGTSPQPAAAMTAMNDGLRDAKPEYETKSDVKGTSVSERVEPGGSRHNKTKTEHQKPTTH